jgi:hypothetical protein
MAEQDKSRRTAKEVFDSHLALRQAGKLDEDIATNYSEDIVMLTLTGAFRGLDGLRACARDLQRYFPDGKFSYKVRLVEGDVAFLSWTGHSPAGEVRDGADTFVIRDGKIVVQTIHYNVER